jgi:ribose-phosphate pyrophosphokinase
VLGGNSHPNLVKSVCQHLSLPVGKSTCRKFSNNETNVMIDETVRDVDVYIVQSSCGSVNGTSFSL